MNKKHASEQAGDAAASPSEPAPPPEPTLIVGIGASAGGLEAFRHFFAQMPADNGMAFVLVQHLAPQHNSMLAELVGRSTSMDVSEAADGDRVQAGHVYVIPPDATLTIADATLQLSRPAPPRQHRWPIDTFFTSLAEDQGDCAVSIVLSGSGSDGARGLRAIKEHGGLTLAQAGYDHVAMSGMPASAEATGLVDDVLQVEAMPARLLAHQRQLQVARDQAGPDGARQDVADHLHTITRLLLADSGHDFSQYKQKTLVRRIQRRMQVLRTPTVPDYIQHLRDDPSELTALFRELLIGVTEFFRDPAVFDLLRERVFPPVLADKDAADTLRIWVPGCATGEEAYSIAIELKEAMGDRHGQPRIQIFATDIDDRAIASARAGRFRAPLHGVAPERVERWFQRDGDEYVVSKAIREQCIFSPHSAIKDPPFMRLDMISCRNLLIYMNADLQERLVRMFHYALHPAGYLLLGPSEGLSRNARLFSVVDKKYRLYQRREDAGARHMPALPSRPSGAGFVPSAQPKPMPATIGEELTARARRALDRYAPAFVVIDSHSDVLRFCGDTGRYLQPTTGAASLNLFTLLHRSLRGATRSAVQQAFTTQRTVVQDGLVLPERSGWVLQLVVEPLPEPDGSCELCVIAFRERQSAQDPERASASAEAAPDGEDDAGHRRVMQLEQELDTTRLQLQAAIEQQETANEELKSANEEYQSVNEELQSSNEELETSKEEMQSINEELQIVNAELLGKNTTLNRLNSDLKNLMDSTQIATLFLDAKLRVTGFTPTITELFHLREGDTGRPILEISARVPYPQLEADVEAVLRDLTLRERLLQGHDNGPVFLARLRPYRTIDNRIDGVVATFTDITERRRQEMERGLLAAIVDSSKDIIIGHALDGTITSWNDGAREALGWNTDKAVGKPLSLLLPQGSPLLPQLMQACKQAEPSEFETVWLHRDGSERHVAVSCSPVRDASNTVIAGSLIARDTGERRRLELAVRHVEQQRARLIDQAVVGVAQTDLDGHFVLANDMFCEIVGRSAQALSALRVEDITHPDDVPLHRRLFGDLDSEHPAFRVEKRYLRPDGSAIWVDKSVSLLTGADGKPEHVMIVAQDITERRRASEHREMMLGELNHRVKNTLASVQAIARQTLSVTDDPQVFHDVFIDRLHALSDTHNLLAEEDWKGVGLRKLVLKELAPYVDENMDVSQARVALQCEDLQLTPKTALALSMALHELTTNAAKYGALSVPEGRVEVQCERHQRGATPWLRLQWREHGGPPVAPSPERGFGTRLIADGLAFELDGEVALQFDPDGLVCTIQAPLAEASS